MATFFDRCFSIVVAASYIHPNEKSPQRKQIKSHSLNSAVRELLYIFKLKCTKKNILVKSKRKTFHYERDYQKLILFKLLFR